MFKESLSVLLSILLCIFIIGGCAKESKDVLTEGEQKIVVEEVVMEEVVTEKVDLENYQEFLKENYNIELSAEVTQNEFVESASKIISKLPMYPEIIDGEGFSVQEMILTSLYYADLDELAYTYPEDKVNNSLSGWENVKAELSLDRKKEFAAAIDSGLINESWKNTNLEGTVNHDNAVEMLGRLLDFTGNYKNFLGNSSDVDIYNKLLYTWNSFDMISNAELEMKANELNGLIEDGVVTGYVIRRTAQSSKANANKMLTYGHSEINHAIQLIALLRSENLNPKIILEPRTSAFLYLADWGEPTASPEYQIVPLDNGNYIAFVKEYDLIFEFDNESDKDKFNSVIIDYAKKDEADEEGLIVNSWWQPLIISENEMTEYKQIKNHIMNFGSVNISSFSLIDNSDDIVGNFNNVFNEVEVEVEDLWVNQAFYNYLLGDFK